MYKNLEVLNKEIHKSSALRELQDASFAKDIISAPLTVAEFFESCKDYPIVFAKEANGEWMATAMLGYKEKENLFINDENRWESKRYIPAFIRRYPFIFVQQNDQLLLAFDGQLKSEDKENESRKFFKEDGTNSEFLDSVLKFLNQYQADAKATSEFIKQLDSWELLEEKVATIVNNKNERYNINGFYVVNEEKLKNLSKKKKDDICAKNALPLITAHLISLSNIQRLGK
ncbi:MAG: SapC family protein [Arcobacteraceae bacterium]|nr:SapC family protein [Arcobacteraceae bacterium]